MTRLYPRSCYRQKSCINDMGGIVHTSILGISPSPRRLNGMKSMRLYFDFLPPLRSLTAQTQKAIIILNTGNSAGLDHWCGSGHSDSPARQNEIPPLGCFIRSVVLSVSWLIGNRLTHY